MRYAKERAQGIADEIKKQAVLSRVVPASLQYKKGTWFTPKEAQADEAPWQEYDCQTMHWYGPDTHYWFNTTFTPPPAAVGGSLFLRLYTQIDEWDDSQNPQFLVFVNGVPTQGMDMYHRELCLCDTVGANDQFTIDIQAYTGTLHSEFQLFLDIYSIDTELMGLYYDLQIPLWALAKMDEHDKPGLEYLAIVGEAVNLLDMGDLHSAEGRGKVLNARALLREKLYTAMAGQSDSVAACIGHTHIDVAWWWVVDQTKEKVARSFSTVLKLMEEYPEYRFMSSQPQLYAFLKERYPELYSQIKHRIQQGRWEAEGGMWVEADTNLPSGESLVRQFLYGKRFFSSEFQQENRILWLPDVFGYSAALPQIMKKCGIEYFMTTKISWNQYNPLPSDTFTWQGVDGSEILTHCIPAVELGAQKSHFFTTYNGMLHPEALIASWQRYQNKDLFDEFLFAYGYGDGGGGPTREMLEVSSRMDKGLKGMPKVEQKFAIEYFDDLAASVRGSKRLPKWVGELYLEFHRGVYTSGSQIKKNNRLAEIALANMEYMQALAGPKGHTTTSESRQALWQKVLLYQFHDAITGVAIQQVYKDAAREHAHVMEAAGRAFAQAAAMVVPAGDALTFVNCTGFSHPALVQLPAGVEGLEAGGTPLECQKIDDTWYAWMPTLPCQGYASYSPLPTMGQDQNAFVVAENEDMFSFSTPFYKVLLSKAGRILSLYDLEAERELLKEPGNCLRVYEDMPMNYDSWNIEEYYTEKFYEVEQVVKPLRCVANGNLALQFNVTLCHRGNIIRQKIRFSRYSRAIQFDCKVTWNTNQELLRVLFPLDLRADEATFDIQFGNIRRSTHTNTSWQQAQFECCAHRWADISEGGYGASLISDFKYGYSAHNNILGLTLLKSGIEPCAETDKGTHEFMYALYPHTGGWQAANTPAMASVLTRPPVVLPHGRPGDRYSLVRAEHPNIVIETVKPAEDGRGTIVRLYENGNTRTRTTLTFAEQLSFVELCDLLENHVSDVAFTGNTVPIEVLPYEIVTLRIG